MYKQRLFVLMLITLISVSCSDSRITEPMDEMPTDLEQNTPPTPIPIQNTPTPTSTIQVKILTSSPPPPTPTSRPILEIIEPQIIKLCPENREVALSGMDLGARTRLIIKLEGDSGQRYWLYSWQDSSKNLIPDPDSNENSRTTHITISPDGKWLILNKQSPNQEKATLWLSSITGENAREIYTGSNRTLPLEISEGEIVIDDIDVFTYMDVNTFAAHLLEPIDPVLMKDLGLVEVLGFDKFAGDILGITYEVEKDEDHFYLYNNTTKSTHEVFQWLKYADWAFSDSTYIWRSQLFWFDDEGLVDMVIGKDYGFDIAPNLDFQTIQQSLDYQDVMKQVRILDSGVSTYITWITSTHPLFAIDRSDTPQGSSGPSKFYLYDIDSEVLYDYCLDRGGEFSLTEPTYPSSVSALSTNGRFLAWTIFVGRGYEIARESVILDITTGEIARIPNVEFIGWGVVP